MCIDIRSSDICYKWFQKCVDNSIILSFKGEFNQSMVNAILLHTDNQPRLDNQSATTRNRVFAIMVESLQNICKHGASMLEPNELKPGIVLIAKRGKQYVVATGNMAKTNEAEEIAIRLDVLKEATKDELNEMGKEILKNGKLSSKAGAGLGLISIVRKSDQVNYKIRPFKNGLSFFELEAVINEPK